MKNNIIFLLFTLFTLICSLLRQPFILQVSLDEEISQNHVVEIVQSTVEPIENANEYIKNIQQVDYMELTTIEDVATTVTEIEEPMIASTVKPTEELQDVIKPFNEQNSLYDDDKDYKNFYGRLYIPSVGIDVALYYGVSQTATDRKDSAAIFTYGSYDGEIIADHNNQDFGKLFEVVVGTTGYIKLDNGTTINIQCIEVINGHNTGNELTDNDYNVVMGKYDYLMYTCRNGWKNIRICQWNCY